MAWGKRDGDPPSSRPSQPVARVQLKRVARKSASQGEESILCRARCQLEKDRARRISAALWSCGFQLCRRDGDVMSVGDLLDAATIIVRAYRGGGGK